MPTNFRLWGVSVSSAAKALKAWKRMVTVLDGPCGDYLAESRWCNFQSILTKREMTKSQHFKKHQHLNYEKELVCRPRLFEFFVSVVYCQNKSRKNRNNYNNDKTRTTATTARQHWQRQEHFNNMFVGLEHGMWVCCLRMRGAVGRSLVGWSGAALFFQLVVAFWPQNLLFAHGPFSNWHCGRMFRGF